MTVSPFGSVYFSNGIRIDGEGDVVCCAAIAAIGAKSSAPMSKTRGNLIVIEKAGKSQHSLEHLPQLCCVLLKGCRYPFKSVQSVPSFFIIVMASLARHDFA